MWGNFKANFSIKDDGWDFFGDLKMLAQILTLKDMFCIVLDSLIKSQIANDFSNLEVCERISNKLSPVFKRELHKFAFLQKVIVQHELNWLQNKLLLYFVIFEEKGCLSVFNNFASHAYFLI
jgi:hypothetical protein